MLLCGGGCMDIYEKIENLKKFGWAIFNLITLICGAYIAIDIVLMIAKLMSPDRVAFFGGTTIENSSKTVTTWASSRFHSTPFFVVCLLFLVLRYYIGKKSKNYY